MKANCLIWVPRQFHILSPTEADEKETRYFKVLDRGSTNDVLKWVEHEGGHQTYEVSGEQQSHFVTEIDHFKYLKLVRRVQNLTGPDEASQK